MASKKDILYVKKGKSKSIFPFHRMAKDSENELPLKPVARATRGTLRMVVFGVVTPA